MATALGMRLGWGWSEIIPDIMAAIRRRDGIRPWQHEPSGRVRCRRGGFGVRGGADGQPQAGHEAGAQSGGLRNGRRVLLGADTSCAP